MIKNRLFQIIADYHAIKINFQFFEGSDLNCFFLVISKVRSYPKQIEWCLVDIEKWLIYIFLNNIIPAWPLCKVERNVICLFVCLFICLFNLGSGHLVILHVHMVAWNVIPVNKWCYFLWVVFCDPVLRVSADFPRSGPGAFRLFPLFFPFFVPVSSLSEAACPSPSPRAPPSNAAAWICAVKKGFF